MAEEHKGEYVNPLGKVRPAFSHKVRVHEAVKREVFLGKFIPLIVGEFQKVGLDVEIEITGSTKTHHAGPTSDLDMLIKPVDISRDGRLAFHYHLDEIIRQLKESGKLPYTVDTLESDIVIPY